MIYSMTGYGSARIETDNAIISAEIKTLNSKFFDLQIKIPKEFNENEHEIRSVLSDKLKRGKVNVVMDYQTKGVESTKVKINAQLFKTYYKELSALSQEVGLSGDTNLLKTILAFPDVISYNETKNSPEQWLQISEVLDKAIAQCVGFREQEGNTIAKNLKTYIETIGNRLYKIEQQDANRIEKIKSRIDKNLSDMVGKDKIDQNRFEQELIYYIEKIDITEEKLRLQTHLDYFLEVLAMEESPGKKLGFVSQEIGREINTIGSKANDALMQRDVVDMKEELEKIKEQLLNIM